MSDNQATERRDSTERRVYNLPADLLERLRAYQIGQGIASEAEAARRLLHTALQLRDSVYDILRTLETKLQSEKDLRIVAAEVLTPHVLVSSIEFTEYFVSFKMKGGDQGRIFRNGGMESIDTDFGDVWTNFKPRNAQAPTGPKSVEDLDDEIPF